jgi:hypothetical protein
VLSADSGLAGYDTLPTQQGSTAYPADVAPIIGHARTQGYDGWYVPEEDTVLTEEPPDEARRRREHQRRVPADGDQQRRMSVGRGTASGCACQRHTWTTRSRTRTMPDGGRLLVTDRGRRQLGVSVRTVERLVAASRPDTRRKARLSTCASYPPTGLEGWAASDPVSPFHWFRAALHHSPARRTNGHTALTTVAHRFHLTGAICRAASTC